MVTEFLSRSPRIKRHLFLAGIAILLVGFLFVAFDYTPERWLAPPDRKADSPLWRLSMALAYAALLFLAATLLIGPLCVVRNRPPAANLMQRRDVGIWVGLIAIAHVTIGMQIHTEHFQLWYLFFTEFSSASNLLPIRISKFGLANYLGLFQLSLILLLLVFSNNRALRWLGTGRWKNIQRLSYVAFASVAAHGFTYQLAERRDGRIMLIFALIILTVGSVQALGFFKIRKQKMLKKEVQANRRPNRSNPSPNLPDT